MGEERSWVYVLPPKAMRDGMQAELHDVEQILGRVLGYPKYCDDQGNFPGATEADGVCVGDNTPAGLAAEAAGCMQRLRTRVAELEATCDELRVFIDGLARECEGEQFRRQQAEAERDRLAAELAECRRRLVKAEERAGERFRQLVAEDPSEVDAMAWDEEALVGWTKVLQRAMDRSFSADINRWIMHEQVRIQHVAAHRDALRARVVELEAVLRRIAMDYYHDRHAFWAEEVLYPNETRLAGPAGAARGP